MRTIWILFVGFCFFFSCNESLRDSFVIYENDFETSDLQFINGGKVSTYNGNQVIGYYNKGGFDVELADLPDHAYVKISIDLYIHGSWDGNFMGDSTYPVGPDIWGMNIDDWVTSKNKASYQRFFETTFSNSPCNSTYCLRQSFPDIFPSNFNPKTSAISQDLPESCIIWSGDKTSLYHVEKIFPHTGKVLAVKFYDKLKQLNVEDEYCDENWSLDNLKITLYSVE